jgi:glycosidase
VAPGAHAPRKPSVREDNTAAGPTVPDWVKDAVFYQIFPDRFANGDVGNDPFGTSPWGAAPTNDSFSGGDLAGITQKMDWLKKLGVSGIYLNPIFSANSNHRYDTTDYDNVDVKLGGNVAFDKFVDTAHDNGIKVMLDGVFNHTSHQHSWFQDVRDNGPKSKYWGYYDVRRWPINYKRDSEGVLRSDDYKSWWGFATLPELKTENPEVRNYFLDPKKGVVAKWLKEGIDGWRMDVADEIEPDFWQQMRKVAKATKPDSYLLAENWHDASSMLQGDQFDGAMNYKHFQQPAVSFFAKKEISADSFVAQLASPYGGDAKFGMFNILDSHDTPRFVTEAGGDAYRLRPAAIFQMTYVGVPVVYYGDELAMEGGKDPDSRRTFPWNVADQVDSRSRQRITGSSDAKGAALTGQMLGLYRTLISTRNAEPALRRGDFSVLETHNDNSTVAYRRWVNDNSRDAVVAINNDVRGHDVVIPVAGFAPDGTSYTDALSGQKLVVTDGRITLPQLDGNWGAILLRDPAKKS